MKLYRRGNVFWADLRAEGMGRLSTGETNEAKARDAANRIIKGRGTGHTLGDAMLRAWQEHYVHLKSARNVHSQIQRLMERVGNTKLTAIDTPWVKEFTLGMNNVTPSTVNRYLALLSKVLKLSCEWGWLDGVPYMPRLKVAGGKRIRVVTQAEEAELLEALTYRSNLKYHWMAGLVEFLLDTGARLGEALAIAEDAREDTLRSGRWTIWVNKGDHPRTIPLTRRAMKALDVWSWRDQSARRCQDAWAWVRSELGLQDDKGFVIHALRHTCATRLVDRDVPLPVIRDYLGHSTVAVTERYAHLNPKALEAAALCLETVSSEVQKLLFGSVAVSVIKALPKETKSYETVNLTAQPSEVQILPPPPVTYRRKLKST